MEFKKRCFFGGKGAPFLFSAPGAVSYRYATACVNAVKKINFEYGMSAAPFIYYYHHIVFIFLYTLFVFIFHSPEPLSHAFEWKLAEIVVLIIWNNNYYHVWPHVGNISPRRPRLSMDGMWRLVAPCYLLGDHLFHMLYYYLAPFLIVYTEHR